MIAKYNAANHQGFTVLFFIRYILQFLDFDGAVTDATLGDG